MEKVLLEKRNERNIELRRKFFLACSRGDLNVVKSFSLNEHIFDSCDEYGRSPLMVAISSGDEHIVQFILHHTKLDINLVTPDGNSALHYACYWGRANIVELLLLIENINYNSENKIGETAKQVALNRGTRDCAEKISNFIEHNLTTHSSSEPKFSDGDIFKSIQGSEDSYYELKTAVPLFSCKSEEPYVLKSSQKWFADSRNSESSYCSFKAHPQEVYAVTRELELETSNQVPAHKHDATTVPEPSKDHKEPITARFTSEAHVAYFQLPVLISNVAFLQEHHVNRFEIFTSQLQFGTTNSSEEAIPKEMVEQRNQTNNFTEDDCIQDDWIVL